MPPLPGTPVVEGLGGPRALSFDADGNLLIAVAGTGGETELAMPGEGGTSTVRAGLTGRIVAVAPDGTATDLIAGFPSYNHGQETGGVYRIVRRGASLWLMFSGPGAKATGAFWTDSLVEYDAATMAVKTVINMDAIEVTSDPDGKGFDTNPSDFAWAPDGTLYITNAGQNSLLSWTASGGLRVVRGYPENPVPTSVEVATNGDLYLGFLGAGIAPGAARIEHWSGDRLVETFSGLTAVTDILLDGDTLYAVQLMLPDAQGNPGPGNVVTVNAQGATSVAEGLVAPFGLAKGPDGALYVSYGTVAFAPGMTGGVVKLAPRQK